MKRGEDVLILKWNMLTKRRVELFVLVDQEMLRSHGYDKNRVNQKIASMVAIMNSLYKPFNIEILVKHIKVLK